MAIASLTHSNSGPMFMSKSSLIIVLILIALVFQGFRISRDSGLTLDLEPQNFGECSKVAGPAGPEDITIDIENKLAFISATDRRLLRGDEGLERGGIWTLDLSSADNEARQLSVDFEVGFFPHGIDLLHLANGERELYVVNHPDAHSDEILVFSVDRQNTLQLKSRYSSPEFVSPNDIRVLASDVFLVSNDHGSPRESLMAMIEDYLGLSRSSVVLFEKGEVHKVANGLRMANGLELSEDEQTLYVAETTGRRITRFKRGESLQEWHRADSLFVDSGVDNLEWDQQGRLLTGAHPKLFDFLGHAKDATKQSPSQVIRIDVEGEVMSFETLYLNMGEEISGSSVAAIMDENMLVGAVYEPHFLRCIKP